MSQAMEDKRHTQEDEKALNGVDRKGPLQKIITSGIMLGDLRSRGSEDPNPNR